MDNKIIAFTNPEFGEVRTLNIENEPWFVAADVCKALEIGNPTDAMRRLDADERTLVSIEGASNGLSVNAVNEPGLYTLVLGSRKPEAKAFKRWITHDVIPSIRKNGEYKITPAQQNRLDIMERNSRAREASLWLRISAQVKSDTYRQVCASYASTVLAGREVIPLPQTTQHHYSATEIGKMFGVSKQAIGNLANTYGMKTDEYGAWYHDKSPYSAKEVDVFKYNDRAVQRFRDLLV